MFKPPQKHRAKTGEELKAKEKCIAPVCINNCNIKNK